MPDSARKLQYSYPFATSSLFWVFFFFFFPSFASFGISLATIHSPSKISENRQTSAFDHFYNIQ